ncbi:hypothetical protein GCM10017783_01430 [Deinococcus piscis]|uniref:Uncharacterized protein n=2 Tax=Deinococcus piscis TaxID=394230 RepID=A0ABQ3JXL3_9DEIO|nr:hypothetical protein GCM10017783_01430 [Deinococcus piscis]
MPPLGMTNSDDLKYQNASSQDAAEGEREEDRQQPDAPQVSSQDPAEGSRSSAEDSAAPQRD